ncbi:MAG: hypothetical protein GEU68_16260 [Actinobacteria bacterium]|nr:hypothetical protein [Actinomycetota bacterium]
MKLEKGLKLKQPRPKRKNRERFRRGRDFWKDRERSTEFGKGVSLAGLSLESRAGYSDITKLWWLSTGRCRRNFLSGGGTDPVHAKGMVYSTSRRC